MTPTHEDPGTSETQAERRASTKGKVRKQQIIEIATRMLARNGARGTTLGAIATAAGVSQAAVVYHFGTKEDLLHAVLDNRDRYEETQLWSQGSDPGLAIFEIIADIVGSWSENPELVGLIVLLLAENVGDEDVLRPRLHRSYQLTVDRVADTLRRAQTRGEMRADVDPRRKAIETLAFLSGLEMAWLVSPEIPAAETAAQWAADQMRALRTAEATS